VLINVFNVLFVKHIWTKQITKINDIMLLSIFQVFKCFMYQYYLSMTLLYFNYDIHVHSLSLCKLCFL